MLFKLAYTIVRLDIHSSRTTAFALPSATAYLRAPNEAERDLGHKSNNAFLDIVADRSVPPKAQSVFDAFLEGRKPPERARAKSASEMVVREGPEYGLRYYPGAFETFVNKVRSELGSFGKGVVSTLRWRYRQEGPPSQISSRGLYCSIDLGTSWTGLPGNYSITSVTPPHSVLIPESVDPEEIAALVSDGVGEPVAHELLREAKELQHTSPRSSLMVAVSAAEIGIKSLISNRVRESAWLVESIQSPPIVTILIDYFPRLFDGVNRYYKLDRKTGLLKTLNDAVTIRNELVHRGAKPPKLEKLVEILDAIEAVLWICDCLAGFSWAETYVLPTGE